jgi:ataxia telangiectasia mutated family protein
MDLLDEEDASLQSWALIAFSHLAIVGDEPVHSAHMSIDGLSGVVATKREETPWTRVWAHATRKIATAALSRAACHTATCLLSCGLANTPKHISDIRTVLANIEIQGPPYPYDTVCAFLCAAVTIARNDATLYQQKLEDRVMGWLMKWSVVEGGKGRARMDQYSAADIYRLVCEVSGISPLHMTDLGAADVLPDCAIVDRLIEEHNTRPLRRLIIHAEFPDKVEKTTSPATSMTTPSVITGGTQHSLEGLQGRPGLALSFLTRSIEALSTEWPTAEDTALAPPERVRKALDMVVAASAYLVTLQASGTHVEPTCVQAIIHLIGKIRPSLASSSHTIPGQHLMWTAFKPLSTASSQRPPTWPILLNASPDLSGIRKVLFDQGGDGELEAGSESIGHLQKLIWGEPTVGSFRYVLDDHY